MDSLDEYMITLSDVEVVRSDNKIVRKINSLEQIRRKKVNNRRMVKMDLLDKEGFFSLSEIYARAPSLYKQYFTEIPINDDDEMGEGETIKLSDTLLKIGEALRMADKTSEELKAWGSAEIEEEEEDEGKEDEEEINHQNDELWGNLNKKINLNDMNSAYSEEELVSLMKIKFMDGKEPSVDYSLIDNNIDFDCFEKINEDHENKYFSDEE